MGRCHCFGRRKEAQIATNQQLDTQPRPIINVTNHSEDGAERKAMTFSYRELATATNNFRDKSVIGEGGFGPVYKGKFETTGQIIAVKKLNNLGSQGDKEFLVEVVMLSLLSHPNLVTLIGYCAEGDQRLLVYEFMPLGSLESHLHGRRAAGSRPLDWNTRMIIAAGAAKGLNYLHNDAHPPVIFRDLKSSNILLDQRFHPKLSDFGLAKVGPKDVNSQGSNRVMGTMGYCAPEYAATGNLTIKSDVYSFGVVLLELISGCRPMDMVQENGKHMLIDRARQWKEEPGRLASLADPQMERDYTACNLHKAVELALMCVEDDPDSRPNMNDVVEALISWVPAVSPLGEGSSSSANATEFVEDKGRRMLTSSSIEEGQRADAVAEAKMWGEACREKQKDQEKGKHHEE